MLFDLFDNQNLLTQSSASVIRPPLLPLDYRASEYLAIGPSTGFIGITASTVLQATGMPSASPSKVQELAPHIYSYCGFLYVDILQRDSKLKCSNMECDAFKTDATGIIIEGPLVVASPTTFVTGPITFSDVSTFITTTNLNGLTNLNNNPLRMGGVQLNASIGLVCPQMDNFTDTTFYYQRYGSILHVSGAMRGELTKIITSKVLGCSVNMPSGYTLSNCSPNGGRYMAVSGGGLHINSGDASRDTSYIASACIADSASRYTVIFTTTHADTASSISGQLLLSFSVYLDQIITA